MRVKKILPVIGILFALLSVSCSNDKSTDNGGTTVTSRVINILLQSDQTTTFRASFAIDGVTFVSGASSVISGSNSVINVTFDGLSLPKGAHVLRATILAEVPAPANYKMSSTVIENGKTVPSGTGQVTAALGINGSIELQISF